MAVAAVAPAAGRVALVAGATGLVGRAVLAALLTDSRVAEVHALGRRSPGTQHRKLHCRKVNFERLPALPLADDGYIALGTTIRTAGSQAAFRAVDLDAVLAFARAARAAGAKRLGVVSAMGADAQSSVFYNRIKGEMEDAVGRCGFETLVIARPSILDGDRAALEQPMRIGERVGLALMEAFRPVIPVNYRAIKARAVAQALVGAVLEGRAGRRLMLSGEMQAAA